MRNVENSKINSSSYVNDYVVGGSGGSRNFVVLEEAWPSPLWVQFSLWGPPSPMCVADVCSASQSPLQGCFFYGNG